jgi:PAS domain S-box-containing protein
MEKAKKYLEIAGVAFVALDKEGNITLINKKGYEILQYEEGELVGKNWFETCLPKKNKEEVHEIFKKLMKGELEPVEFFESLILTKIGEERIITWHSSLLFDDNGKISGTLSSGEDITERKKAEEQLKLSEEKIRETYNRAEFYKDLFIHDINNILQIILSGIQLSEMYIDNPEKLEELKTNIKIIKEQVGRGTRLVSNIRKLSRLEETEISIKKIEIYDILKKSITYVKNSFQDRNIKIQIDFVGKKFYIQANDLLEDVFENILINAVKYNENPTVEIIVKISKEQRESINYLKMEFLDNGIGIDDIRKNKIFIRAYSEGISARGMGLGLSLVKKIIENYNGKIWVEDRVKGDHSKGSNFILLIPEVI